jgi:acyl carrier protein
MRTSDLSTGNLQAQLRVIIAQLFRLDIDPDNIANDQLLIGGNLELDSLDRVELAICIEEAFGIALPRGERGKKVFRSIASLEEHIRERTSAVGWPEAIAAGPQRHPVGERRVIAHASANRFFAHPIPSPNAIQG